MIKALASRCLAHPTSLRTITMLCGGACVAYASIAWAQEGLAGERLAPAQGAASEATSEDFAFARRLSRVFKSVATKVEPAVVHVTQYRRVQRVDFFGRPIGATRLQQSGLGSGAIIESSGIVVTNNHVIEGGEQFKVRLDGGEEFDATLVGRDPQTDLAVLQIVGAQRELPTVRFADSDELQVGEWVIAVGSPFGLDSSVTQGIVSAKGRSVTPRETGRSYEDYIQTDAAINPGNSGGPLLNLEGAIVGINTAIASRTGGYDGIGFAIPSNTARLVVDNIRTHGRVLRGWLGIGFEDAEVVNGQPRVRISTVQMGSPAEQAGLREGDVITRFQGVAMNERRLRNAIGTLPSGSQVMVDVERDGEPLRLSATLSDRSSNNNSVLVEQLGLEVRTLDKAISDQLGLTGVIVVDVLPDTRGANRFEENDIIVAVDGEAIEDVRDFERAMEEVNFRRGVQFNVIRAITRGNQRTLERGFIEVRD